MKALLRTRQGATFVLLGVLLTVAAVAIPQFRQAGSINSLLLWAPLLLVVAVGQLLVMLVRGIDVSVGSTLGLAGILSGMAIREFPAMPLWLAAAVAVATGTLLGAFNGLLVAYAKVPPIVATIGTLSAYRGLTFIVSGGHQIDANDLPAGLIAWSLSGPVAYGGVVFPWLLVIALLVAAVAHGLLHQTQTGRNLYAVGSNPEGARLRGVPVERTLLLAFTVCGALAGLAGLLYASRFGFVNPATAGAGFELTVIAAVVIAGTNVFGGVGSVPAVVAGCFLLAGVNVSLSVLGVAADWQLLAYGTIILIALVADGAMRKAMLL